MQPQIIKDFKYNHECLLWSGHSSPLAQVFDNGCAEGRGLREEAAFSVVASVGGNEI